MATWTDEGTRQHSEGEEDVATLRDMLKELQLRKQHAVSELVARLRQAEVEEVREEEEADEEDAQMPHFHQVLPRTCLRPEAEPFVPNNPSRVQEDQADDDLDVAEPETESVTGHEIRGQSDMPETEGDSTEHAEPSDESQEHPSCRQDGLEGEESETEHGSKPSRDSSPEYSQEAPLPRRSGRFRKPVNRFSDLNWGQADSMSLALEHADVVETLVDWGLGEQKADLASGIKQVLGVLRSMLSRS